MQKSALSFIPFLLLIVPIMEIGVFILVGGQIGVINTLLGVIFTAVLGTVLLRQQGFALLGQAQQQMDQGKIPGKELAHGVMLLAAGLLLLTPGFVTDSIGFLLLVPTVRDGIFHFFKSRIGLASMGGASQTAGAGFSSYHFSARSHPGAGNAGPSASSSRSKRSDIIDLDEEDFSEVLERDAIGSSGPSEPGDSPWKEK